MKAITSLALFPLLIAAGACSSNSNGSSSQKGTPLDSGTASGDDASEEGGGDGAAPGTSYEAKMSGANVANAGTPAPVQTPATGDALLTLESDMQTLDYDITQNVAGAQSVNIHVGAPLEINNIAHQLTPVSQHMKGKVTLTMDEVAALGIDQLYIDVISQAHPGGEIRGQVVSPGSIVYVAVPTGAQEVPSVTSSYVAHASFIVSSDGMQAIYHVMTGATPTNVLLERAIASMDGQVVYPLTPVGSTVDGTLTLGSTDPADFQAGHFYVNIQTQQNMGGELRGQVIPSGATLFNGALLGTSEVPPVTTTQASGGAQFILMPDLQTVAYEIDVNGIIPTAADLYQGALGKNGSMLDQLSLTQNVLTQNGALGTLTLPSNVVQTLQAGGTYVSVETASYPSGEVRAQLMQH